VPPSNHFEKLRGNLAGFHSVPRLRSSLAEKVCLRPKAAVRRP
jgi:plasmid maintenance system killer protein